MVKEGYADLKDGRMFYRQEGSGHSVLLLHPLGSSSWAWHMVQPDLARRFNVFALDMLGAGNSDKPPRDGYMIEDHAANVTAFMEALKIPVASVVGNSVGAMIAIQFALMNQYQVKRLVLIGCPVWTTQEGQQRVAEMRKTGYDEKGLPRLRSLEETRRTMPTATKEMVETMNTIRAQAGPWALKTMEALANYDVPSRLGAIRFPALVMYGARDALADKKELMQQKIRGSRLEIIADAGHVPQLERPREVASAITEFLTASPYQAVREAASRGVVH